MFKITTLKDLLKPFLGEALIDVEESAPGEAPHFVRLIFDGGWCMTFGLPFDVDKLKGKDTFPKFAKLCLRETQRVKQGG